MPNLTTTLGKIKPHLPCESGWEKLCKTLGTSDADTPVTLLKILDNYGFDDAVRSLRCWDYRDYCPMVTQWVESVEHMDPTGAAAECNRTMRQWYMGNLTLDDLRAAATQAKTMHMVYAEATRTKTIGVEAAAHALRIATTWAQAVEAPANMKVLLASAIPRAAQIASEAWAWGAVAKWADEIVSKKLVVSSAAWDLKEAEAEMAWAIQRHANEKIMREFLAE